MSKILLLMFTAMFADNIVLSRGVGTESADASSNDISSPAKYGVLFTLITACATSLSWVVRELVIVPFSLTYLRTPLYVISVVIPAIILTTVAKALLPKIYGNFEVGEGIITDFALFGVILILDSMGADFVTSLLYGVFAALGFVLVSVVFAAIKKKMEFADIPKSMRTLPLILIAAGIVALVLAELGSLSF